jgi:hypothetical protein
MNASRKHGNGTHRFPVIQQNILEASVRWTAMLDEFIAAKA